MSEQRPSGRGVRKEQIHEHRNPILERVQRMEMNRRNDQKEMEMEGNEWDNGEVTRDMTLCNNNLYQN